MVEKQLLLPWLPLRARFGLEVVVEGEGSGGVDMTTDLRGWSATVIFLRLSRLARRFWLCGCFRSIPECSLLLGILFRRSFG